MQTLATSNTTDHHHLLQLFSRHKDRPTYHWGHLGVMTCHGVSFILVLGTVLLFHYRNKKLEQAAEEANLSESEVAQLSTKEQAEFRWRYTL